MLALHNKFPPFAVFLVCFMSGAGEDDHLAHLVLGPNVFLASVVKDYGNSVLTLNVVVQCFMCVLKAACKLLTLLPCPSPSPASSWCHSVKCIEIPPEHPPLSSIIHSLIHHCSAAAPGLSLWILDLRKDDRSGQRDSVCWSVSQGIKRALKSTQEPLCQLMDILKENFHTVVCFFSDNTVLIVAFAEVGEMTLKVKHLPVYSQDFI